jgi:ATP-binding cassette, subfamily B, bacterial
MHDEKSTRPSIRPYRDCRAVIVAVSVLSIITGLLEMITIVSIVGFIEGVTSAKSQWELAIGPLDISLGRRDLVAIAFISAIGMTVGQVVLAWMKARAASGLQYRTQMRAVRAYMGAGWSIQAGQTSGSLQNLMSLAWGSSQGVAGLMALLTAGGAVLIFGFAAFLASPLAAGVLVFTVVVLSLVIRPVREASRKATQLSTEEQRDVTVQVGEIHDLAQEIRVHDATKAVQRQMAQTSQRLRSARQRAAVLSGLGSVLYRSLGLMFVLVAAVVASSQRDVDLARVGVAGLLLLRSLSYGQNIQAAWQTIVNNRPYIDQVNTELELYQASAPHRGVRRVDELGTLTLKEVSYTYDGETPALNSVSFELSPGETLGVVGPSGSGKSTLAQILLGLREPTDGLYLAGGTSAMDIAAENWFRMVTVVPQQVRLLHASVLDNIVFHRPWVSREQAIAAAASAGLHDEIEALPHGFDTQIGESVRDLSGGQRQRLGIARALAGSPQLLVLDEPTSALDAMSESRVQETLSRLKGTVTVVIIAHRLATLNYCDRLIVLESGAVSALDTPGNVMRSSEFYQKAVKMQLVAAGEASS